MTDEDEPAPAPPPTDEWARRRVRGRARAAWERSVIRTVARRVADVHWDNACPAVATRKGILDVASRRLSAESRAAGMGRLAWLARLGMRDLEDYAERRLGFAVPPRRPRGWNSRARGKGFDLDRDTDTEHEKENEHAGLE